MQRQHMVSMWLAKQKHDVQVVGVTLDAEINGDIKRSKNTIAVASVSVRTSLCQDLNPPFACEMYADSRALVSFLLCMVECSRLTY